jgi:hypothetical protein
MNTVMTPAGMTLVLKPLLKGLCCLQGGEAGTV